MRLRDHWFYCTERKGNTFSFDQDELRHATKTLRLKVGDELQWTDGCGGRFEGRLTDLDRRGMQATCTQELPASPSPSLHLAVGMLHDAGRMEWLVEKATELGVGQISLLQTQRVQHAKHRLNRLAAKCLSAMKQSGRAWLPVLAEAEVGDFLTETDLSQACIAHCYSNQARKPLLAAVAETSCTVLLIGPEGDFTETEVEQALAAGCIPISLGGARLRTETAAIAAVSALYLSNAERSQSA